MTIDFDEIDFIEDPEDGFPFTPYAGTSGWSGSETSRERAECNDADGTTKEQQQKMEVMVRAGKVEGIVVREVRDLPGWHHGSASGALSVLHKEGRIQRLKGVRRGRFAVYVAPEYVNGRETVPQGRKRPSLTREEEEACTRLKNQIAAAGTATRVWVFKADALSLVQATQRLNK